MIGHTPGGSAEAGARAPADGYTIYYFDSDVIELSKKDPDKWSYGTSGVGGPHHLSGEYFKRGRAWCTSLTKAADRR